MERDLSDPKTLAAYVDAIWEGRTLVILCSNKEEAIIRFDAWYDKMEAELTSTLARRERDAGERESKR
jgi:hypothetical protein